MSEENKPAEVKNYLGHKLPTGRGEKAIGISSVALSVVIAVMMATVNKERVPESIILQGVALSIGAMGAGIGMISEGRRHSKKKKEREELVASGKPIPMGLLDKEEIEFALGKLQEIFEEHSHHAREDHIHGMTMDVEQPDGTVISGIDKFRELSDEDYRFYAETRERFFKDGHLDVKGFKKELKNRKSTYGEFIVPKKLFDDFGWWYDDPGPG